jgi:hypothetical protein
MHFHPHWWPQGPCELNDWVVIETWFSTAHRLMPQGQLSPERLPSSLPEKPGGRLLVPVAIKRGIPRQIAKDLDVIKTPQSGSVTLGISLVVGRMPPAYKWGMMPFARLFGGLRRLIESRTLDGDILKSI